jgi:hypothetical protein
LASPASQTVFVLAGLVVELVGLVLEFRCHLVSEGD